MPLGERQVATTINAMFEQLKNEGRPETVWDYDLQTQHVPGPTAPAVQAVVTPQAAD